MDFNSGRDVAPGRMCGRCMGVRVVARHVVAIGYIVALGAVPVAELHCCARLLRETGYCARGHVTAAEFFIAGNFTDPGINTIFILSYRSKTLLCLTTS